MILESNRRVSLSDRIEKDSLTGFPFLFYLTLARLRAHVASVPSTHTLTRSLSPPAVTYAALRMQPCRFEKPLSRSSMPWMLSWGISTSFVVMPREPADYLPLSDSIHKPAGMVKETDRQRQTCNPSHPVPSCMLSWEWYFNHGPK